MSSSIWQRIPGDAAANIADLSPLSYAVLVLPPAEHLRSLGIGDSKELWGRTRDHPYAKWTTHSFSKGTSLKQALSIVEQENSRNKRLIKARITFFEGVQMTLERSDFNNPGSLTCVSCYNPSAVFLSQTQQRSSASRSQLRAVIDKPLSDLEGRIAPGLPKPKSFAPEILYRNCPPPLLSQPGYDFTPISHTSFLVRPNVKLRGVRQSCANTAPEAVHYRPRAFVRALSANDTFRSGSQLSQKESRHACCAEVSPVGKRSLDLALQAEPIDARNTLTEKKVKLNSLGATLRPLTALRPA